MSLFGFLGSIFGGGDNGASREAERIRQKQADDQRADTDKKAAALRTGMTGIDSAFAGFDDNYFAKLQKDYLDYAMPQLADQYNQQRNNINFALARKGNLASSTAGDQYGALDRQNDAAMVDIEGGGKDYANQARNAVQANKQDIIGQLNTTYDADAATNLALSQSKSLAMAKPSFSRLGQMFQNISAVAAQNKIATESDPAGYRPSGARTYNPSSSNSYLWNGA